MTLVEIKGSKNVAAAGFDAGVIRVLFHGGRYADYPDRTAAEFDELLAAPSKGRFVRERLAGLPVSSPDAGPLNTYGDDPCCSKGLAKALRWNPGATLWECPKCSVEWIPELVEGVRHWRPRTWVTVLHR